MTRVAFLSWRDTTHPDGGGAERYLEEVARRLVGAGHEVTVCCAAHGTAPADEVVRGVRFRRRGGRLTVYPRGLLFAASRQGRRQDVIVDVVNGLPFGARLVRRHGLVVLLHHLHREQWKMIYPGVRGTIGWLIESRLVPRLYRRTPFVAVSESTEADLVGLGVRRDLVSVVRNGVDSRTGRAVERSPAPRLCVLARLVPHKQIEHALHVVAALTGTFPELRLDIVGAGWWAARLRALCTDLALDERVEFHGRLADEERDVVLARAWLMLAPSVREGWGIAIMEAAAVGTPTVAYRNAGGVTESVVAGHTGLLADDLADLVRLTEWLLRDEVARTRLSEAAAARAGGFSWDQAASEFAAVLAKVSGRRTG